MTVYKFFSSTPEILSRTDHMLGHKKCLNKFKKTEWFQAYFLTTMLGNGKLRTRRKLKKNSNLWKLNHILLKKLLGQRRHERNQNIQRDKWKWKYDMPKFQGCRKAVLRGNCLALRAYLKKREKSQRNNLILHIKEPEKEEQMKPKVSRKKGNNKNHSGNKWNREQKDNRKN